ncbi:DNA recombination protein RmuC [Candidatus Woesearchaeota archaeon]|nr:DNA recombination protein RmuC [Candidatus Woesearchaeota archaeon]
MAFIEFLMVIILILLIIILLKLKKKQEPQQVDTMANQLLLNQLEKIEKEMDKKSKDDSERQEKMVKYVEDNISSFTRTIHGTKRRGKVGESILQEMLSEPIKSGLIVTDLDTDSGKVEFAWDLKNGKHLPIDSKLPEVEKLYSDYDKAEDAATQTKLKKQLLKQIEDKKSEVQKYLNNHNTIDKCIVAIPDAISDMFPDINKDATRTGIFVAGYTKVFLFACILSEYYLKSLETGEIGVYRDTITSLKNILKEIEERTNTINRGIVQISGANKSIQTEVDKSMNKIGQLSIIKLSTKKKTK